MNEKDIQKIYVIFFVALLVMFLQTNFTRVLIMDIRNLEDSAQISIHLFHLHNKYYISLLNLNRNICVISIVVMIDEGLKRCSFDCGIAL